MQLKFIEEQSKRSVTYRKRIGGLKKKSKELAILCDVPVLVISFAPQGQVQTWPEDKRAAEDIIDRYRKISTDTRSRHELDLAGYMKAEISKHQASFNRRLRDSSDTPLLPLDDLLHAMHNSLRELAYQLDSIMEAIKVRIQLLKDRQNFNGGETINFGGQCQETVPYLTMNTCLQHPSQPMSFSNGEISTDAFLQYAHVPVGMDEVPLAMVPSIPMNMDEVPFTMLLSIPTSSMSTLVHSALEYDFANRDVVPVHPPQNSIGLFGNHNLVGGGEAEQDHTNIVVAQNNVHHLADSFRNGPLIGAGPKQTSVSNEPWPYAWKP